MNHVHLALRSLNLDGRRGPALLLACLLLLLPTLAGDPGRALLRYERSALAAGVLAHVRKGEPHGWLLAGLLAAKLLYEQAVGALPFSGSDPVVVDAHLYGVAGGVAVAAFLSPQRVSV